MRSLLPLLCALLASTPLWGADRWLPVREIGMELDAKSPLNFSGFLPQPPVEAKNRIVIGKGGHLARADAPETPARLMCASLAWSSASGGFPDHDGAERYARQLRLHGYDIARFHFVDGALMTGRAKDFDFDPDILDRVHYLMAALKRNGISWIVDGMSSTWGSMAGHDDQWERPGDMKLAVQIDDKAFRHWLTLQKALLGRVNPYTGLAPIRDPALAVIVPVNENGLEFDSLVHEAAGAPAYPDSLRPLFNRWLKVRYGSTERLAESWGRVGGGQRLEDATIALPADRSEKSPRMKDLQAFFIETEQRSSARMTKALRDMGFKGVVAPYNNWPSLQTSQTRATQQAVAMNTYWDWIGSYAPGGAMSGASSLADGASYLRALAASRWLGRPFIVTEYDQLFWNPYRYEAGLAMPAYASLQGWDALCRHAHGPIILAYGEDFPHKRQMLPYAIALDPVARAGETLAALLFRRGDVASSSTVVAYPVRKGEAGLTQSIQDREGDQVTGLALLSAIGLAPAGKPDGPPPALTLPIDRAGLSYAQAVSLLRPAGRLDPANGPALHVSDTGEIRLDRDRLRLQVVTPRTEAIAFDGLSDRVTLGRVTVETARGKGLFAVSSLDGRPIKASRRMLVIFATDARNTDMRFSDAQEHVIADFGRLPVLIRAGTIRFTLPGEGRWRLSPVGLDGVTHPPVASGEGPVETLLSNDAPDGPTTYFLIERR